MPVSLSSASMPAMIYGTAWKKDTTQHWVETAYALGFRGFDTACQPKHYFEPGVGRALAQLFARGVARESLYIQTKFSPLAAQDPNDIPYDPGAPLAEQVQQSFAVSRTNLQVQTLDALVLHSPVQPFPALMEIWRAMESLVDQGGVARLGISNCYERSQLERLCGAARIAPVILQNRFYPATGYDRDIRGFCRDAGIAYQSFWTLTANPHLLAAPEVVTLAEKLQRTPAQILFRWLQLSGVVPLTGTRSEAHMREDLECERIALQPEDVARIGRLLG